jgi:DNA polymerase sigma
MIEKMSLSRTATGTDDFQIQRDMVDGYRPSMLCIEDPLTPGNDIGRSSYGALKVKQSFEFAYTTLLQAVSPMCPEFMSKHSILGRIVRITDEVVEYRQWIKEAYADKVPVSAFLSFSPFRAFPEFLFCCRPYPM